MSRSLIKAFSESSAVIKPADDYLDIAEFYYDTIQGEGVYLGQPAAFLRLKGCTLNCVWCDTKEVWRQGNPYTFTELFSLMFDSGLTEKLHDSHHLVITGGSPLKQQERLVKFLEAFYMEFGFRPFVEIENECVLMPSSELISNVNCWNNSPKLSGSGMPFKVRYNSLVLGTLGALPNSWFKFVIQGEEDWKEILGYYLQTGLITKDRIILMPEGVTEQEIAQKRRAVIDMAIRYGVRYTTREHIIVWGRKTGI